MKREKGRTIVLKYNQLRAVKEILFECTFEYLGAIY